MQKKSFKRCESNTVAFYQTLPFSGSVRRSDVLQVIESDGEEDIDSGARKEKATEIIADFESVMKERKETFIGYPCNLNYDFETFAGLNAYSLNNAGDPFIECSYGLNSRPFEVGVLRWFAKLWDIEVKDFWGYVTTGGTEGNLHGIYLGREHFPDGILYTSSEAHYSILKIARICGMSWEKIPALESGEINYDLLKEALERNSDMPAILNVNIGTTFRGAIDNLDRILEILAETGYTEDRFYIHCDGALFGIMLPFLERDDAIKLSFKKPISSISVSGHKFLGSPAPCGVLMTRRNLIRVLATDVKYLNTIDATIMGSRDGHTPIYIWYNLSTKGRKGLKKDVEACIENSMFLKKLLDEAKIPAQRNELSNTVFFQRPPNAILINKWQLACEGDFSHIVVMPHCSKEKLKAFVIEYVQSRKAFVTEDVASIKYKKFAKAGGKSFRKQDADNSIFT